MIIGIDLDNTIVDCDGQFKRLAEDLFRKNIPFNDRLTIRDLVRTEFGDNAWTEIQAEVYGPSYILCEPHKDAVETLEYISDKVGSKNLYIISHKTKFDSFGKGFDLRNAANQWLDRHVWTSGIVMKSQVKYCSTKAEKIGYIQQINCHIFFDDLEEIIDELQGKVRFPILFDRRSSASQTDERRLSGSWAYLADFIDQQ